MPFICIPSNMAPARGRMACAPSATGVPPRWYSGCLRGTRRAPRSAVSQVLRRAPEAEHRTSDRGAARAAAVTLGVGCDEAAMRQH